MQILVSQWIFIWGGEKKKRKEREEMKFTTFDSVVD